jgi:outer membrane cobalamin receptor
MKRRILIVFFACLVLSSPGVMAQRHTVSGYMTDARSGESLIGAAVVNPVSGQGSITNNYGFYTFTLPEGEVSLEYSYMGYYSVVKSFNLLRDTVVNIAFEPALEALAGATVTASRSEIGVRGTQMSAIEVPVNIIKSLPAIGGEVDVIKALQLLPGVQSGTEGSAGLYVRGGGPDENLLLLDGVPLYNVNHMGGFFSVFDADAIKNVTLYKGSFPARFGSRLSSVVDVRLKDGNDQELHGSASIGLLSAKFNLEGPIVKGKTTFNISARRTYYDILAAPIIAYAMKMENTAEDNTRGTAGYYFYDLNAKITHRFGSRDKLFLSYYMGDDNVYARLTNKYSYDYDLDFGDYDDVVPAGPTSHVVNNGSDVMRVKWKWGNIVGAARWNHVFSPKLFMNLTLNYTQYRHNLDLEYESVSSTKTTGFAPSFSSDSSFVAMGYRSLINDISSGADFEYKPSPDHDIRFGANYTHHMFRPAISSIKYAYGTVEDGERETQKLDTTFGDKNMLTDEVAAYAEDNYSITSWFKLNLGVRWSLYRVSGKTYNSVEPRVGMRFLVNNDLSFKASYSEMSQYIHLLSNSNLSLPTDLWVPVTAGIEPMRSRQAAAGVFYSLGVVDFSVEGYYKTMDNVLEYRDGASFLGSTSGWESKVACGRGWSYGVEFLAQKKVGATTGWIAYTWSKAMRQFDREGQLINFGEPFPAKYDRRHDLSIVVNHAFNERIDVSGTFVYGTGICGSLAMQNIQAPSYEPGGNEAFEAFSSVPYLEGRNNYRLPDYHRLDLAVNFHKQLRRCERIWSISCYNVYNRQNPFMVYQGTATETRYGENEVIMTSRPTLEQLSIFPIMPSVSLTYRF